LADGLLSLLPANGGAWLHLRSGERRCRNGRLQFRLLRLFLFAIAALLSFRHSVLPSSWIW
jgi:hypothetical protein